MPSPAAPFWLLPFDPDADYVFGAWPKGFTVNGMEPRPGQSVDKSAFRHGMLAAYYEKRWIRRAEPADISSLGPAQFVVEVRPPPSPWPSLAKRKGGRPKGSRNRPKDSGAAAHV